MNVWKSSIKLQANVNESWWELRSESLHARAFHQLSWPGQTRIDERWLDITVSSHQNLNQLKVDDSWQARVCTRVSSTLMHAPVEWEQELRESWLDITVSSHQNLNQLKVDDSWQARVCTRVSSTLMHALVEWEQELRESWLDITVSSHQNLNQLKLMRSNLKLEFFIVGWTRSIWC
jgi:hypothetical protein